MSFSSIILRCKTVREIYYTRVRAQIINNMNSSLDSYLVNGQMARNKVRVKSIQILSAASLLSTDIFVCTQFGDTYYWQLENRDPRKQELLTLIGFLLLLVLGRGVNVSSSSIYFLILLFEFVLIQKTCYIPLQHERRTILSALR